MIRTSLRDIAFGAALACSAASTASAHAYPTRSEPAAGSTLNLPPHDVRIWFTEALEPAFSSIAVLNDAGSAVTAGKNTLDPKDRTLLEVPLKPLPAGTYHVKWRVISIDTHLTQGDFTFSVAP